MNALAHAIVNLLILGRPSRAAVALPILAGGIAPDLPAIVLHGWQRLGPGSAVGAAVADPRWQVLFDVFNSIPLLAVFTFVLLRTGRLLPGMFVASMLLHTAFDLLLNGADAHRHFIPFADWRFEGPLSFRDPHQYAAVIGTVEAAVTFGGAGWALARYREAAVRAALIAVTGVYIVARVSGWAAPG